MDRPWRCERATPAVWVNYLSALSQGLMPSLRSETYRSPCIVCCRRSGREHKRSLSQQALRRPWGTQRWRPGQRRQQGPRAESNRRWRQRSPLQWSELAGGPNPRRIENADGIPLVLLCSDASAALRVITFAIPALACFGLSPLQQAALCAGTELMPLRSGQHTLKVAACRNLWTARSPSCFPPDARDLGRFRLSQTAICRAKPWALGLPSESPGLRLPLFGASPAGGGHLLTGLTRRLQQASRPFRCCPWSRAAGTFTASYSAKPGKNFSASKPNRN